VKKTVISSIILTWLIMPGLMIYGGNRGEESNKSAQAEAQDSKSRINRIISLTPSITEILFTLGLGEKVVGVTSYCDWPPEAKKIDKIGGYYDPNYELVVAKRPDLVIMLYEHEEAYGYLRRLGIDCLRVDHKTIKGITESIITIGRECGASSKGEEIAAGINGQLKEIGGKVKGLKRPKVMICVGRNMGSAGLQEVFIAGKNQFYDELITAAGGTNVYQDEAFKFPAISREGIMRLDPEVIIDLVSKTETKPVSKEKIMEQWDTLKGVKAVDTGRVYVFDADYVVIPGPRVVLTLRDMVRAIHPEVKLD